MKSCKLVNTNGVVSVFNSDGSFSKVYQQALEKTNSIEEATKLWSYTQTELWEDVIGTDDATDLNEVFRFLNNLNELEVKPPTLSSQEVEEVRKLMTEMGIEDSNGFVTKMNNLFQPKGFFEINRQRLLKSGLYDNSDIDNLDVKKVKNFLAKMNIYFSENEISNTEVFVSNIKFKDVSTEKNSLGFHSFIPLPQIALEVADLTDDFSKKGIEEALLQTEFAEGVESQTFVNNLYNYLSNKTKVQKMSVSNGEQVTETNNIVRNTLLSDQDTLEIEETNSFLGSILPSVWESKQKTIESYLRKVEKMLTKYNVDVIGISGNSLNREGVISLLNSVEEMMKNPTEENIQNFSNLKDELIPAGRTYVLKEGANRSFTNVVVDSNMSQEELFETQGLLKLNNEGVYQLIDRAYSVEELYDELYQRVLEDSVIIDEKYFNDNAEAVKDPLYEAEVKEALKRWINSRQIGFSAPRMGEEISLYQVLFNHNSIENNNNYTPLSGEFSEDYLTTSFVSDFYNYILDEKYKDSDIYKNVLQYFSVGGSDINYNHPTNSVVNIEEIKYSKELKEYAKLKKEGSIKAFADSSEYVNEDLKVLNNPNLAQEVQNTEYNISDGYLVTKGVNANTYLTEGGKLYRKLFDDIAGSVYAEVVTNNDNVYNDLNLDFSYDATEAKKRLKEAYNYFSEQSPKNPKQANVSPIIESSTIGYYTQTEIDEIIAPYQNENGELTYEGQRFDNKQQLIKHLELKGVLDQLMKTNLAKSYHILSPEQIQAKLVELGVDAEVAFQISAWHGSPHKFDRFSTEFMGTGEGAQAFGWGLYFTDLESIARNYAESLSKYKVQIDGEYFSTNFIAKEAVDWKSWEDGDSLRIFNLYLDEGKDALKGIAGEAKGRKLLNYLHRREAKIIKDRILYNVTLHKGKQPSEYTWLEWDKPLDKNTADVLLDAVNKNEILRNTSLPFKLENYQDYEGNDIYGIMNLAFRSPKQASLFLLENGIDGIKYPAESISRGATSDNARGFNYVVFDENAVTIEETIQFQKEGITLLPNGFYHNGKVYINKDLAELSTLVHEFSHSYNQLLKNERPEFYQEGLRLIEKEGQQYVDFVKVNQPNLQGEALLEEALAQAVGDAGARLVKTEENKGLLNWLQNAWNNIKQMLGLSSYTIEQVRNMSLQEYTNAVAVDLLRGEEVNFKTPAEEYFERNADRLPLTLAVFNRPEFKAMQGKMVNPITVLNSLNQSGIKQIEKDLIKQIIQDNYQGQKRISYDELEATVRANIMPLERIFTSSYSEYGMDNLGDGNYGEANTIILNSPIEHGVTGHFSGDFKASGRKSIKYVPKQLNDNVWVAVEEGYENQANDNNIYQFVGTAGTKESVDAWIENYKYGNRPLTKENTKLIKDGGRYILLNDKNSPVITLDREDVNTNREDIHQSVLDNYYTAYPTDINKGMFGHIRVWETPTEKNTISVSKEQAQKLLSEGTWIYTKHGDKLYRLYDERDLNDANNYVKMGKIFHVAELQSDYFQKNKAKEDLIGKNTQVKELEKNISNIEKLIDRKDVEIDSNTYKIEKEDGRKLAESILDNLEGLEVVDSVSNDMFKNKLTTVIVRENGNVVFKHVIKRPDNYDTSKPNNTQIINELGEGITIGIFQNLLNIANKQGISLKEDSGSKLEGLLNERKELEKRLKEEKKQLDKVKQDVFNNLPSDEKQFIASQKEWEKRMVREAIKEASLSGATSLRFPTAYTLSVIEGYLQTEEGTRQDAGIRNYLENLQYEPSAGDMLDYLNETYIVTSYIEWDNSINITKLRNYDRIDAGETFDEQEFPYFIETDEYTYIARVEPTTENISLELSSVGKENFSIENDLSDTQQTVARKYEEIAEILKTERGDNFEVVTDDNGFDWYETKITPEETNKPVIAFQIISPETNDIRYQIRREYEQQKLNAIRKVNEIDLKITTEIKEDINECSWIS